MTPDERDDLARQIALLITEVAGMKITLDLVSTKIDATQQQNVRHMEHLRGDFKNAVEARADQANVLAYESSEMFGNAQRQNVRLSEINAQLVERIEPLCDTLNALTAQLRGLTSLTAAQ